ncbi:MAG: DUF3516 domain-containing protein [Coriobacteriales bacterium]|nr:DUF3516 domain-containing protein [Coriobacteriales bacterium]
MSAFCTESVSSLDQPLSPFLFAALELLDPESETYALDVVSMCEATIEDPRQILRIQEKRERDKAIAQMKADGVEYDERMERLQEVTYPKPLEELLDAAFGEYCKQVPWANDYELSPKSVLRDMLESAADFKGYIAGLGLSRSEGTLLRYLSDCYRVLARTVPPEKRDDRLKEIIGWLELIVRSVDSSLVDEWARAGTAGLEIAPPPPPDEVVHDRHAVTLLVRNALMRRVLLAARSLEQEKALRELGELDLDFGFGEAKWRKVLDAFYEEHEELLTDTNARSAKFFSIDESPEKTEHAWRVHQVFCDSDGDFDFGIMATVDLDATQEAGEAVFSSYKAGSIEELLHDS